MAKYDVLIIGSGLGGLECAYILAKEGYSVCVLEKNRQLGGNLQIFVRDKVIFDTGVHYIGGLDEGQNLHQYFTYFGLMDKLKLRRMDPDGFDRVTFDNDPKEYRHAMGFEHFYETLAQDFPKERAGIQKYCQTIQDVCDKYPVYRVKGKQPDELGLHDYDIGAKAFIDECVTDPKLRSVLGGSNPLYVGYPDKTPLYVHALVTNTYIESSWKCVDGGAQIARYLARNIKDQGGEIYNYSEVNRIIADKEGVKAVETTDGRRFEAKYIISNIHPAQTLDLVDEGILRKAYRKRIKSLENSLSVFSLHLVFKPDTFEYLNHNYYHYKENDVWSCSYYKEENWPENYVLFVPANSKSEKYADSMNVMAYMRFEEVAPWADTHNTIPKRISDRGKTYEEFKEEKAELLFVELEKKFPGIRSKVKSYYTTSPLSYRDYIGTSDGSMYGIMKDYNNPLRSFISPRTKVPNLYLTGQNLNMHGMLGVTVSSFITCSRFLGLEYLINKVKESN